MNLYPMPHAWEEAKKWMREGFEIHQQFVCENCNAKQTIEETNQFFTSGSCEECSHITNLQEAGCNFMAIKGDLGKRK